MTITVLNTVFFCSVTQSCLTLCNPMNRQASLSITNSWSLLKPMSIKSVMSCNRVILCCPHPPAFSLFQGLFKWVSPLHQFSSLQFSLSVVSDSLWPHELQHARPPCPSPAPGVYSDSCPSSWWCHPSGSQIIGASTSASVFQWIFRTDFL